jgi:hypothetical protein
MALVTAIIKPIPGETTRNFAAEPVDFRLGPEYLFGD